MVYGAPIYIEKSKGLKALGSKGKEKSLRVVSFREIFVPLTPQKPRYQTAAAAPSFAHHFPLPKRKELRDTLFPPVPIQSFMAIKEKKKTP